MEQELKYQVIYDKDENQLVKDITAEMNAGWKPLGGVAIAPFVDGNKSGLYFAQALVR